MRAAKLTALCLCQTQSNQEGERVRRKVRRNLKKQSCESCWQTLEVGCFERRKGHAFSIRTKRP